MSYQPVVRNYQGIKHQKIREQIDPLYDSVHDLVSAAYYDYWRQDISHPITIDGKSYDKQATVKASETLMNELCDMAWQARVVLFHQLNKVLPAGDQFPETEYRYLGPPASPIHDWVQEAQNKIAALSLAGRTIDYKADIAKIASDIVAKVAP